ncbi:hemin uptake protein HemP [Comamonas sp.]
MQATLSSSTACRVPAGQPVLADSVAMHSGSTLQEISVDSQWLLRGQKSIAIVHNGATYRLQATKLGKLILTK